MAAGFAALAMFAVPAVAKHGSEREKSALVSTSVDDDASGIAKLKVRNGSDGRFDLVVKHLDRNATYEVLVNDVHVGQITTNGGGGGHIRFRSRPRSSRDELLGFDPRGAVVTVRSEAGDDVLVVRLSEPSSVDGAVICCIPDDRGPECEDRTADECTAQGGGVARGGPGARRWTG